MPAAPLGTIDLSGRACVACGDTLKASGQSVVCRAGHRYARLACYAYKAANVLAGGARPRMAVTFRQQRAPEPPALQAALEELHRRKAELAAVVQRERALREQLDERATGPGLIEWLERRALAEPVLPTLEDAAMRWVLRRYESQPFPTKISRRPRRA